MQKAVKISEETYSKLDKLRNGLFPFKVSFPKIIKLATDELEVKTNEINKKIQTKKSTKAY
mgnify:CR=1 FL=1|jgi:hypothetical protein|tara:strand:- start:413 stop:595 length:183 start_codon:yes stop_codon:yes gene_type:complete